MFGAKDIICSFKPEKAQNFPEYFKGNEIFRSSTQK